MRALEAMIFHMLMSGPENKSSKGTAIEICEFRRLKDPSRGESTTFLALFMHSWVKEIFGSRLRRVSFTSFHPSFSNSEALRRHGLRCSFNFRDAFYLTTMLIVGLSLHLLQRPDASVCNNSNRQLEN
ncbi:hypothetical protein V6N12_014183 [Hibiscus sabdariffa]|uniref:Uncharacterized protein n=1 Tax=Hibiscus sabdariffa TaxID=183260 RepID=A0ABR2DL09_9ROSI